MARIRSEGSPGPRSPEDLLAQARRRGMQIRQRRQVFAAGGAAVTVGLAAVILAVAWPGPSHRLVQVVSPTTAATNPTPTTAASPSTTAPTATTLPPRPKSTTSVPSAPRTTVATPVVASPTTSTPPPPPVVKTVTDANNGTTVSIRVGSTLIVKLAADNWTIGAASDQAVLAMQGSPRQIRTKCIPGGTCGTTTASFRAGKPGAARVTAGRNYCGEVIRCTKATGSWSISVIVTS